MSIEDSHNKKKFGFLRKIASIAEIILAVAGVISIFFGFANIHQTNQVIKIMKEDVEPQVSVSFGEIVTTLVEDKIDIFLRLENKGNAPAYNVKLDILRVAFTQDDISLNIINPSDFLSKEYINELDIPLFAGQEVIVGPLIIAHSDLKKKIIDESKNIYLEILVTYNSSSNENIKIQYDSILNLQKKKFNIVNINYVK